MTIMATRLSLSRVESVVHFNEACHCVTTLRGENCGKIAQNLKIVPLEAARVARIGVFSLDNEAHSGLKSRGSALVDNVSWGNQFVPTINRP